MITSNIINASMVDYLSDNTIELNQGKQYPQGNSVAVGITIPEINVSVKAYPNPITNSVNLEMNTGQFLDIDIRIHNVKGEELDVPVDKNEGESSCQFVLHFHRYANGIYFLSFHKISGEHLKTIKVQKIG